MLYIFFFQAEDGIRDTSVTGVQTCALPISSSSVPTPTLVVATEDEGNLIRSFRNLDRVVVTVPSELERSEERRVGKECSREKAPAKFRKEQMRVFLRAIVNIHAYAFDELP